MARYIFQRLLWMIVTIIAVAIIIFTIMYFVPGDPARIALGKTATQEEINTWRENAGLNEPYVVQLSKFLSDTFLHFDLGTSYSSNKPVVVEFAERLPRTLKLGLLTILIDALIGIPLGVTAAMHQNKPADRILIILSMLGVSVPDFWLAEMLIILFSLKLRWLPAMGIGGIKYWIMPVISASVAGIAMNARQTRSAVLETKRADFVTTARAKGVKEHDVIYKHMLPNALIPVVNNLGGQFATVIAGTVVIESVFSFPGIGLYLLSGISSRDYPVIRGCVLILALFASFAVLIVDLIYAWLDPRIKASYANTAARKAKVNKNGGKK
jgi:ABC-type dipeptide/oligopeptide/nickel transport system permease component